MSNEASPSNDPTIVDAYEYTVVESIFYSTSGVYLRSVSGGSSTLLTDPRWYT